MAKTYVVTVTNRNATNVAPNTVETDGCVLLYLSDDNQSLKVVGNMSLKALTPMLIKAMAEQFGKS